MVDFNINAFCTHMGKSLEEMCKCYLTIRTASPDTMIGIAAQKAILVAAAVGIISGVITGSVLFSVPLSMFTLAFGLAYFTSARAGSTAMEALSEWAKGRNECAAKLGKVTKDALIGLHNCCT